MNLAVLGYVPINCPYQTKQTKCGDVLAVIAAHVGDAPGANTAWPSHKTIAKLARCSEDTVNRALKQLVKDGELSYVRHGGPANPNGERPNLYTVPTRYLWETVKRSLSPDTRKSISDTRTMRVEDKGIGVVLEKETSLNTNLLKQHPYTRTMRVSESDEAESDESEPAGAISNEMWIDYEVGQAKGRMQIPDPPRSVEVECQCIVCDQRFLSTVLETERDQVSVICSQECARAEFASANCEPEPHRFTPKRSALRPRDRLAA